MGKNHFHGKNFAIPVGFDPSPPPSAVMTKGICLSCNTGSQYLYRTEHGGQHYPSRCRPCLTKFQAICAAADAEDERLAVIRRGPPKYSKQEILEKFEDEDRPGEVT